MRLISLITLVLSLATVSALPQSSSTSSAAAATPSPERSAANSSVVGAAVYGPKEYLADKKDKNKNPVIVAIQGEYLTKWTANVTKLDDGLPSIEQAVTAFTVDNRPMAEAEWSPVLTAFLTDFLRKSYEYYGIGNAKAGDVKFEDLQRGDGAKKAEQYIDDLKAYGMAAGADWHPVSESLETIVTTLRYLVIEDWDSFKKNIVSASDKSIAKALSETSMLPSSKDFHGLEDGKPLRSHIISMIERGWAAGHDGEKALMLNEAGLKVLNDKKLEPGTAEGRNAILEATLSKYAGVFDPQNFQSS